MTRFAAFLRAVNVGGRKLSMDELRRVCVDAGLEDVQTYIQSGNVACSSNLRSAAKLEALIEDGLRDATGLDTTVIARTSAELAKVVAEPPWPPGSLGPTRLVVVFLKTKPKGRDGPVDLSSYGSEVAVRRGKELYVDYVNGQGRSKVTNAVLERLLGVRCTARNWNTVEKMLSLTSGS